jgi:hypothetical protein
VKTLLTTLALGVLLFGGSQALIGNDKERVVSFGALEAVTPEAARAQAAAWLKNVGKADAATLAKLDVIWKQNDRPLLDRLADTLALGSGEADRLLREARDPFAPPPVKVADIFKDAKQPAFFRANLGLAYARALSNRRVHEEALDILKLFTPEQVVSPTTYLFHRAVCEHALLLKPEASRTISRLLDDSLGSPERYKTVSALMLLDMQTWKDKDLGAVARKMENIERRLELARGGPQTQKLQKEVILRLDELIKELENKSKKKGGGGGDPNGGGCPNGGPPQDGSQGGANPTKPMQDSVIANNGGSGRVDPAKMRKLMEGWGKMQRRDREQALLELTRGMSPRHREAIENYFRNLAQAPRK